MHTCAETNFINVFLVRMCLKLCVIYLFFLLLLTPPFATIPHNWTDPRNLHPCLCTLRPWQNGRNFADDIFKCIFLNENAWISLKISLKFVPKVRINNIPALVKIIAWRLPGDKPLSEPMTVYLLTHICVTRPQWVNERTCRSIVMLNDDDLRIVS